MSACGWSSPRLPGRSAKVAATFCRQMTSAAGARPAEGVRGGPTLPSRARAPWPATLAAYDHASGLALLRVIGKLGGKPLRLGDAAALAERDPGMVVTAPARDEPTLVRVVSRRPFTGSWEYLLDEAIYTYPAVMEWSGAPLIGSRGELLG